MLGTEICSLLPCSISLNVVWKILYISDITVKGKSEPALHVISIPFKACGMD